MPIYKNISMPHPLIIRLTTHTKAGTKFLMNTMMYEVYLLNC